jgi:hypothetical protein
MRVLRGQDLMQGSDHEFIVNLYRRILLRGPDETGYRHHRDVIEADPGCRRSLIEGFAGSSEASRQPEKLHIVWDDGEAVGTVASKPDSPELSIEKLLLLLRQKLDTLDAANLAAAEEPLLRCLETLIAARLKALKQSA